MILILMTKSSRHYFHSWNSCFNMTSHRLPNDLWPLIKGQNRKPSFCHDEYWIKGFLGQGIKKWHCLFNTTSQRPTSNLRPLLKNIIRPIFCPVINLGANLFTLIPMYFNIHYGKRQGWIPILTSDQRIFDDLWEAKTKMKSFLTSHKRSEVISGLWEVK